MVRMKEFFFKKTKQNMGALPNLYILFFCDLNGQLVNKHVTERVEKKTKE